MQKNILVKRMLRSVLLLAMALLAGCAYLVAEHGRVSSPLEHADLPYYGRADLRPRWDWLSTWHQVGSFAMLNQHGQALERKVLAKGPTVVSFFFTSCATVCPVSTDLLLRSHSTMKVGQRADGLQFLSISVMPLTDDPPALRKYAQQFGLPSDWILATGVPHDLVKLARESFYSDIATLGSDGLPPHLNRAFLLDQAGHIRGIYDASSAHEMVRLQHDVARLTSTKQT